MPIQHRPFAGFLILLPILPNRIRSSSGGSDGIPGGVDIVLDLFQGNVRIVFFHKHIIGRRQAENGFLGIAGVLGIAEHLVQLGFLFRRMGASRNGLRLLGAEFIGTGRFDGTIFFLHDYLHQMFVSLRRVFPLQCLIRIRTGTGSFSDGRLSGKLKKNSAGSSAAK